MNRLLLFIVAVTLFISCSDKKEPAELIITNGKIYTANDQQPTAEAVAITNGKIVAVGSKGQINDYKGDNTEVIDLEGKTMTPGFIEGHGHIMGVGYNELNLDLMSVKSYEQLVAKVKEAVAKAEPGQWIVGRGWHQDKWDTKPAVMIKGFQTHHLLSEVSPNNPVFLRHASGHAAIANAKAMEIAGVNQLSIEKLQRNLTQDGGEVIKDPLGNPTGIFNERAMGLISQHIPANDHQTDTQALELAIEACLRNGITSFHDAGATRQSIDLFHEFKDQHKLRIGLYVMITGFDRDLVYE